MRRTRCVIVLSTVGMTALLGTGSSGHTPIASRFTYNEHLFPIFQRQCGSCHINGGVAPMSLLSYNEAYPWTQSIREEVLGLRMPPWKAEDGFGEFANGHVLPAHEMDMILEWSAGGYPQGPSVQNQTLPMVSNEWTLGPPTVELTVSQPFLIDSGTNETVHYFVLPTDLGEDRWISAVDVIPGSRAIVRHVSLYMDTTGQAKTADRAHSGPGFTSDFNSEQPIAVWWPGQNLVDLDEVGYALPAGADIVARVLYKKTWITEGQPFTDQTRFGLYLNDKDVRTIQYTIVGFTEEVDGQELIFTHKFDEDISLLGLFPEIELEALELRIEALFPDGSREPLLLIREPDPTWPTRYWLDSPKSLPRGSQIETSVTRRPGAGQKAVKSLFASNDDPVRLLIEYTSAVSTAD